MYKLNLSFSFCTNRGDFVRKNDVLTSSIPLMRNVCEFSTFKGIMAENINKAVSSSCDIYLLSPFWLYVSKGNVFIQNVFLLNQQLSLFLVMR